MKALAVIGVALLAAGVLVILAEPVSATTTCHATGNWCQGYAHVSTTTGGVASARCFALRTVNTAPTCTTSGITPSNAATWEMVAGACLTVYYFDTVAGVSPPAVPNKVNLRLFFDNSITVIQQIYPQAAEPASGSSYTVCATSDGTSTGSPRAGMYNLHITAIKDNAPGGVGNYNIKSDGTAAVGTIVGFDNGALRGQILVANIAPSAYPAGSTFAYGAAATEQATITATFTQPNGDNNLELISTGIVDSATLLVGQQGSLVDVDATTTLAQAYDIDQTFPAASGPYVPYIAVSWTSSLTGGAATIIATSGNGAGIVRFSDLLAYKSTTFNINPEIKADADGSGGFAGADDLCVIRLTNSGGAITAVFNKGETVWAGCYLVNARDQLLSRAMTYAREDATPTTCAALGSITPSSNLYTTTSTLATGAGCVTTAGTTGAPRYLRVTNTDQSHRTASLFGVSPTLFPDSHIQVSSILVPDDYPTEDAGEYFNFLVQGDGLGGDMSDTIRQWCKAENVRHENLDTSGSAVTRTIKDPTGTTRVTGTTDTGADGWTPTSQNLLATSPLGTTWTAICDVAFNGNTGTDTEIFSVATPAGGGDTYQADPLKVFASLDDAGEVLVAVSASYLDGTARTGAASDIDVDIYDPSGVLEVSANPVEVGGYGVYRYTFTPTEVGNYFILARTVDPDTMEPITMSNALRVGPVVAFNGTDANATLALLLDKLGPQGEPVNIESSTLDFWVPLVLWLGALLFFLKLGKLMAAGAATAGVGLALATSSDLGWMALALIILVLALWLEATLMEGIYQRWFGGKGRRQAD